MCLKEVTMTQWLDFLKCLIRNFARSDEIRDLLNAKGIILEDTKDGVRWKRK